LQETSSKVVSTPRTALLSDIGPSAASITTPSQPAIIKGDTTSATQQSLLKTSATNVFAGRCDYPVHNRIIDRSQHIVPPPEGDVTLVCCNTTKGFMTIAVHPTWAPVGAQRFLDMVNDNFFSTKIGLFRAMKGFLVQFGLAGDTEVQKVHV
jgi:hypothetical protein